MEPDQKKMEDFFSISKDKKDTMQRPQKTDQPLRPPQPNSTKGPSTFISVDERLDTSETFHVYAFPFFISRIWNVIKPNLQKIKDGKVKDMGSFDTVLRENIQSHYASKLKNIDIDNLKTMLQQLNLAEATFFFDTLLPFLAGLALQSEHLFKNSLPILKQNRLETLTITKQQAASILANMFFCTLHKQSNKNLRSDCNFASLYRSGRRNEVRIEKLKCLYTYFKKIHKYIPQENIEIKRLVYLPKTYGELNLGFWENSQKTLRPCILKDTGSIEDERDKIQVDFANRVIGGGLLEGGCVQEEIRFLISPETFVSLLVTETLQDHEAIVINGTDRYCSYTGYGETFKFALYKEPNVTIENKLRLKSSILALDALDFSSASHPRVQFKIDRILRELNKAYIGFYGCDIKATIATGRWGCGVFLGDSQLKFVIQWMAASQASMDLVFYRFNDERLKNLEKIMKKFQNLTIKELFEGLRSYNTLLFNDKQEMDLFEYLLNIF